MQRSNYPLVDTNPSVAFAGGALIDGVWGSKRRVTGVAGVTGHAKCLNLLYFIIVTHHLSFACIRCYKPNRCYSGVYKSG